ncbi:MAG TPA: flavodoxin domain-containing protein [Acidimicrobiales bacterium]|nr:flavodoxin domain-containing protein [Acidimicrobiales bacterium]
MRALVTYGSKRGGTAGLAGMLATALRDRGMTVDLAPAAEVGPLGPYDLVVVGGALYAGRWHRDARRFVRRHRAELRQRPVWLFSSGPLGDDQQSPDIPPARGVAALARRIGARGHTTFGGALAPDAQGAMAHAIAARMAGDWRDPAAVDRFAGEIVHDLAVSRT